MNSSRISFRRNHFWILAVISFFLLAGFANATTYESQFKAFASYHKTYTKYVASGYHKFIVDGVFQHTKAELYVNGTYIPPNQESKWPLYVDPTWSRTIGSGDEIVIIVYDGGNWDRWEKHRFSVVDTTPPSRPSLQTPSNGSSTSDQTPYFNWTSSSDSGSGVSHYEVEIYDKDWNWGDISTTRTSSNYTPSSNIPHDRIYWKIRAVDNAGNKSSWTSEWWFDLAQPNHSPAASRHNPTSAL